MSLALASFSAMAAESADLVLKGLVAPILEISIEHETIASGLDLSKAASNVKVATLTEKSNYVAGYKIKAASTNAGKLVNVDDSTSFVGYGLTYDGSTIPLNVLPTEIYSTPSARGAFQKVLRISYNRPATLSAGSHEDTVQFTIEAN